MEQTQQLEMYMEFMEYGRMLSANTVKNVLADLTLYGEELVKADRAGVERFVINQNKQGLSTATVSRRVSSLRGFFEWQTFNGYRTGVNPAAGRIAPKIKNDSHEPISYNELMHLYNSTDKLSIKVGIALCGFAGLRIGEVTGIVELNKVYRDSDNNLAIHLKDTKGGGERKVSLALVPDPELIEKVVLQGGILGTRGVLSSNGLWRQMSKHFKEQGHEDLSPHGLRATFATISTQKGVRVDVVRDVLGHTTLNGNEITSRYVGTVSVEDQAAELLERWGA